MTSLPPAGWYPDPAGQAVERFWDGQGWSQATRDARPETEFEIHRGDPSASRQASSATGGVSGQNIPGAQLPGQYSAPGQQWPPQPHGAIPPNYGYPPHAYYALPMGYTQGGRPLAGFGIRLLGYLVDMLLLAVISEVLMRSIDLHVFDTLMFWLEDVERADPTGPIPSFPLDIVYQLGAIFLIQIGVWSLYRCVLVGLMQATLGQKLCGLRVVRLGDQSLSPVGWKAAIIRGISGGVLYCFIGFLAQISAGFTEKKQTLPDMISKTVVIRMRGE